MNLNIKEQIVLIQDNNLQLKRNLKFNKCNNSKLINKTKLNNRINNINNNS